jgi:predicted amidohydrolase
MQIAALQFAPVRGDIDGNIERMRSLTGDLRADLLVLPELASTGYFFTHRSEIIELAEHPERGAFCAWMRSLAAERGMVVIGGFAERDDRDRLYNAALVALPDGGFQVYRKSHLFYKEKWIFEPGDTGFFVTEWSGWRVGTMICYDWRFPESSRTLALMGADVIGHPSNLVAAASLWGPSMGIRAIENKVIVATANRCGGEVNDDESLVFSGESRIIAMNGAVLAIAGSDEERVIAAEADPFATRKKSFNEFNDIFADRRPELYTP